jgi:heptosyltransferase II
MRFGRAAAVSASDSLFYVWLPKTVALPNYSRILVRATNWVGDAVMNLPALRLIRVRFPDAHIAVLARPWVADIYSRESFANEIIPLTAGRGAGDWKGKWAAASDLRRRRFDCAVLFQNAFEAAVLAYLARIPERIGYNRDGRGFLLTRAVAVPKKGEIPRHESYYYIEMLRRVGIAESLPHEALIRMEGTAEAAAAGRAHYVAAGVSGNVIGVSPGAAFGSAKRWLPERFAEASAVVAGRLGATVAVFGSAGERELCDAVAASVRERNVPARCFAGETSLRQFIDMAAACRLFLTNDSGAMHVASALGVPTVTVFGATDDIGTGPTGPLARIVREPVDCSPCLLRECPIDHRCMTRVETSRVVETALRLLDEAGAPASTANHVTEGL